MAADTAVSPPATTSPVALPDAEGPLAEREAADAERAGASEAGRERPVTAPEPVRERGGEAGEDQAGILARVERRYADVETIQARFTQQVDVQLLGETRTSRGVLYQQRPNLFAMRFTDPEGDLIIADGRYLWMYHPSADDRQVMRSRLADGSGGIDFHREFLERAEERFVVQRQGSATVQGRQADVLVLRPRQADSPYRQVRIWVDRADSLVRRFEIVEENGNVRRVELESIEMGADIPQRAFRFEPPPQARVYDQ